MNVKTFISLCYRYFNRRSSSIPEGDPNIAREIRLMAERENAYSDQISAHQSRVYLIWLEMKTLLSDFFKEHPDMEEEMKRRIISHDDSKLKSDEFPYYCQEHYPIKGEHIDEKAIAAAHALHYKRNDHHPEYWLKDDGTYCIPENKSHMICALFEMVCDWEANNIYSKGQTALLYFVTSRKSIALNPVFDGFVTELLRRLEEQLFINGFLDNCKTFRTREQLLEVCSLEKGGEQDERDADISSGPEQSQSDDGEGEDTA